jgi:aquaporin rerated protein, invertebrate
MGIFFVIAEIVGATLGYGLLVALTPSKYLNKGEPGLCMTVPHGDITTIQAFFIEFCLTFTLILVISGAWDPRNRDNTDSIPLRIGD